MSFEICRPKHLGWTTTVFFRCPTIRLRHPLRPHVFTNVSPTV
ncbi:hypothetical protein HSR121_1032 [Halapricum desulfuricans]|uniref:Uncharacterized protein n=1 Tax=Halapricum desulfuricans TaxID=2841257 RepID=A0A897N2Q4_9EURY|nr:hypothetical protein HSR121_1032 [Halapricum desulfuricans]